MNRRGFIRTFGGLVLLTATGMPKGLSRPLIEDSPINYEPFLKYIQEHGSSSTAAGIDYIEAIVPQTTYRIQIEDEKSRNSSNPTFFSLINRAPGKRSYFDIGKKGHANVIIQNNPKNTLLLDEGDIADSLEYAVSTSNSIAVKPSKVFNIYNLSGNETPDALFSEELKTLIDKLV